MTTLLLGLMLVLLGLTLWSALVDTMIGGAFSPDGRFVDVDGTRIHYVDRGEGPVIVMVHGLSGQLRHFTYALADELAGEYRVIMIDRPGSGHSWRLPGASARIRAQGELVARFLEKMALQRVLLVGHSLGGAVALAAALDHPQRIAGLALVAPLTHRQEQVPKPFAALGIRSRALRTLLARTLLVPLGILSSRATLAVVFGPEPAPRDFATRGGGLLSLRPRAFLAAADDMQGVNEDLPEMETRYGELALPAGILFGTEDGILDWRRHGEAMRGKVAGLTLQTLAGGHMLPLTQPQATARFIRGMAERAGMAVE